MPYVFAKCSFEYRKMLKMFWGLKIQNRTILSEKRIQKCVKRIRHPLDFAYLNTHLCLIRSHQCWFSLVCLYCESINLDAGITGDRRLPNPVGSWAGECAKAPCV
jgi:hypothetical protein